MAHINIPVSKIKRPWLRRLAVAISLPLVIALRIAIVPAAFVLIALDAAWCAGVDVVFMTKGAANVWRSTSTTASKG